MTNHRDSLQHGIAGRAGNNRPYCRRTAAVAMVSANVAAGVTYAVDPMPSGPVGVSLVASSDPASRRASLPRLSPDRLHGAFFWCHL